MKKAAIIAGAVFVIGISVVYALGVAEVLPLRAMEKGIEAITYLALAILGIGLAVYLAKNKPTGSS